MVHFVSDESMLLHYSPFASFHLERPDRLRVILDRLKDSGVLNDVTHLTPRSATEDEIAIVHTKEYIREIREVVKKSPEEMEAYCGTVEDIYVNEHTYDLALLAAGSAIDATKAALTNKEPSFAAIRPPGHHAFPHAGCGFCIFNNVAICAKQMRKSGVDRVLIVDWDVHAGQGTQECIEGDDGIRLVSIHRYQHGTFWPNLEQSAVNNKFSNTINVPLNTTGMTDSDFLSIFHFFILPLIRDFSPSLILVSCGFDAAYGDPEGEMKVTPIGYGTMTRLLVNTGIPLSVILEGGYFLPSIALDAEYVLRALKGEHMPPLRHEPPKEQLLTVLHGVISRLVPVFPSFRILSKLSLKAIPEEKYEGKREMPIPFPTRDLYHPRAPGVDQQLEKELNDIVESYKEISPCVEVTVSPGEKFTLIQEKDSIAITSPALLLPLVHDTVASFFNVEFPIDRSLVVKDVSESALAEFKDSIRSSPIPHPLSYFL